MNSSYPKITIVTPSYNQGHFIERTILSVINQNYPNLEYIIIDGGSTDNTVEIIKKYEKWITYWISEKDNGQTEAINKGIKRATGTIINSVMSDDLLVENALFNLATAYTPETQCYLGKTHIIDENDLETGSISHTNYSGLNIYDCLEIGLNQPGTFFNISVMEEIGLLNEKLQYSFDLDYWKRFLLNYNKPKIAKMDCYIASFRIHEASKTNIEDNNLESKFSLENAAALKSYFSILEERKVSMIQKILKINTNANLAPPILNKTLVKNLANEIINNYIIKVKKDKGVFSALKYYTYLDSQYIFSKAFKKLGLIKR